MRIAGIVFAVTVSKSAEGNLVGVRPPSRHQGISFIRLIYWMNSDFCFSREWPAREVYKTEAMGSRRKSAH